MYNPRNNTKPISHVLSDIICILLQNKYTIYQERLIWQKYEVIAITARQMSSIETKLTARVQVKKYHGKKKSMITFWQYVIKYTS